MIISPTITSSSDIKDTLESNGIVCIGHLSSLARKITKILEKSSCSREIQLQLLRNEGKFSGFSYTELPDNLVKKLSRRIKELTHFDFVPNTVGKSKPSLYFTGEIPSHIDKKEDGERTYGLLVPASDLVGFEFFIGQKSTPLEPYGVHIFDHEIPHEFKVSDYEKWLGNGGRTPLFFTASVL